MTKQAIMKSSLSKCKTHITISPRFRDSSHDEVILQGYAENVLGQEESIIVEIDNGCAVSAINPTIVKKLGLKPIKLKTPIEMVNIDGTENMEPISKYIV